MTERIQRAGLQVDPILDAFIADEALPETELDPGAFWEQFAAIVRDLTPKNRELLAKREELQEQIDAWHEEHRAQPHDAEAYKAFLTEIGYLVEEGKNFRVTTKNVDDEIAQVAGPQLVVPVMNARFALNAANARWGSLFDALYGTDIIPEILGREKGDSYNPRRGELVISLADRILDDVVQLDGSTTHASVKAYKIVEKGKKVTFEAETGLGTVPLKTPKEFVGYTGPVEDPSSLLFCHNGLHVEIQIDRNHNVGADHHAGVKDVLLESAITTIQDCEDSVAAVDAEDKTLVYRNWLGLMKGTLESTFQKGDQAMRRTLVGDRTFTAADGGEPFTLPGRSLLLVRNVGHLMTSDAIVDENGDEIYEGIMDGVITSLCALHDLQRKGTLVNSRAGSIYIVKPKMHGPEEVAFTCELFDRIEDALGLERNTIKVGIMDEERRTSVNLRECIRIAKARIVFINTGFLDRTGDEIHTSMRAGIMVAKEDMKQEKWILAYENANVDVGLASGLSGHAQIGKGMWPKPDEMREMFDVKINHPNAGADCAWVPSPTAATLHAVHYHRTDVKAVQKQLKKRKRADLDDILTIPLFSGENTSMDDIAWELDNNAQGILGYVVRWIDQGIGCSKVPDINDVGLMEDRATCRISSQHMANWLLHGMVTEERIMETMRRMARVVDHQNADDPGYRKMSDNYDDSVAFQAACDLVLKGLDQPSGYTEPILHARRKQIKARYKQR